jgi:predicted nuclease of predicted toxin-antitoxin system
MDFKIDENLPKDCLTCLHGAGHDAHSVLMENLVGASDSIIADVCKKEKRVLLTLDLDFANIRNHPPNEYTGIIVFRVPSQDRKSITILVEKMISFLKKESPVGKLWIVEPDRVRIRE